MTNLLLIALGGGLGALCRYGLALLAAEHLGARFAWGTLLANLIGCFLIGVAFGLVERGIYLTPSARLFFMTGFLGALTTFSTYALETVNATRTGYSLTALANVLVNNIVGIVLVFLGIWLVQWFFQEE